MELSRGADNVILTSPDNPSITSGTRCMTVQEPSICFITNSLNERDPLHDLVPALIEHTNISDPGIIAWYNYDESAKVFENNAEVLHLNAPRGHFGIQPHKYKDAKQFMQEYDIIQTNTIPSELHGKLLSHHLDMPIIHREGNVLPKYPLRIRGPRFLSNLIADKIVCVSDPVYHSFHPIEDMFHKDKKTTIHNGVKINYDVASIDFRSEFELDNDDIILTIAATMKRQKAYDILLPAFKHSVENSTENIHLFIAGKGHLENQIKQYVYDNGLDRNVRILGYLRRKELYALMEQSDIFVMPSRYEGFSMAVLQAMATKTPCILSDIDPFTDYFRNESIIVRVNDKISLTEGIISLAEDPRLRQEISDSAFQLVEDRFSAERMAINYYYLYRDIKNG